MGACRDGGPLKRSGQVAEPTAMFSVLPAESVSSFDVAINLVSEDSLISVEDSLASGRRSEIGKECGVAAGVLL
jgi:hypothetical protein